MERFKNYIEEESFKLVDMDVPSYEKALELARKAGVKIVGKKTRTGIDATITGPNKKVGKFIMSLPESNANWAKSLELIKRKRLTSSDKKKLDAIRDLLKKEK